MTPYDALITKARAITHDQAHQLSLRAHQGQDDRDSAYVYAFDLIRTADGAPPDWPLIRALDGAWAIAQASAPNDAGSTAEWNDAWDLLYDAGVALLAHPHLPVEEYALLVGPVAAVLGPIETPEVTR